MAFVREIRLIRSREQSPQDGIKALIKQEETGDFSVFVLK